MERNTHIIDAKNRPLGRLATEIAILLRGKHKTNFAPYKDIGDFVVIENIKNIKITGKKFQQKIYYRHSGYPGGLKEEPFEKIFNKRPGEVLRRAVLGMLPKNKLRAQMIKRLNVK